jgi:hypothetical protein
MVFLDARKASKVEAVTGETWEGAAFTQARKFSFCSAVAVEKS